MSEVPPLATRIVAFKEKDKEYRCSFRDIDTLLYQWKNNTLPEHEEKSTGAYFSKILGWDFAIPDAYLLSLDGQCENMRREFAKQKWGELTEKVSTGQLRDPSNSVVSASVDRILGNQSVHDLPPMVGSQKRAVPVEQSISQGLDINSIFDIATAVLFLMTLQPDVREWGLKKMVEAGYSKRDLAEAEEVLFPRQTRR